MASVKPFTWYTTYYTCLRAGSIPPVSDIKIMSAFACYSSVVPIPVEATSLTPTLALGLVF